MDNLKYYEDFVIENELKESLSEEFTYFQNEYDELDENFNDHIKATAAALYKVYKNADCWAKSVQSFVKDNKLSSKLADELIKVLSGKEFFNETAPC